MAIKGSGGYVGGSGMRSPGGEGGGGIPSPVNPIEEYIIAAGITDPNELSAIDKLVGNLYGAGSTTNKSNLWVLLDGIYPMSPTSLEAAGINLKEAGSNNIFWAVPPSHSVFGVKGNGTTQYGLTGFLSSNFDLNQNSLSYCSPDIGINVVDLGTYDGVNTTQLGANSLGELNNGNFGVSTSVGIKSIAGESVILSKDTSVAVAMYVDGVLAESGAGVTTPSLFDIEMPVMGRNTDTGMAIFSPRTYNFVTIGVSKSLVANEAQDLDECIYFYRAQVQAQLVTTDMDVARYIVNAGITNNVEANAVASFVSGMKGNALWSKMHTFNLLSPTSLNACKYFIKGKHRYTFPVAPGHDDTGIIGDGLTTYGQADFAIGEFWSDWSSMGMTTRAVSTGLTGFAGGTEDSQPARLGLRVINNTPPAAWWAYSGILDTPIVTITEAAYTKVLTQNRTSEQVNSFYENGLLGGTSNVDNQFALPPTTTLLEPVLVRNRTNIFDLFFEGTVSFYGYHNALSESEINQIRDLINNYAAQLRPPVPIPLTDAEKYIEAAGITNQKEIDAVNRLVDDLKAEGLWTQLAVIYPLSPTSLEAATYNLKDPTKFKITWLVDPVHTVFGVQGDGLSMIGTTNYNPFVEAPDMNAGSGLLVSVPAPDGVYLQDEMGCYDSAGAEFMSISLTSATYSCISGFIADALATPAGVGIRSFSRVPSNFNLYNDSGNALAWLYTDTLAPAPNSSIGILGRLANDVPDQWSPNLMDFACITKGYSSTNFIQPLTNAINDYNRDVRVEPTFLEAYFQAAGITSNLEMFVVERLVQKLTVVGLILKLKAMWLMSPTSLHATTVNIMNPGTHDITWNGGVNFSPLGVSGNGVDGYGDCNFNPATEYGGNRSQSCGWQTNNETTSPGILYGGTDVGVSRYLQVRVADIGKGANGGVGDVTPDYADTQGSGMYSFRSDALNITYNRNSVDGVPAVLTGTLTQNANAFLFTENLDGVPSGVFSDKRVVFGYEGVEMTSDEIEAMYRLADEYNRDVILIGRN
jgi:hypothetical protein